MFFTVSIQLEVGEVLYLDLMKVYNKKLAIKIKSITLKILKNDLLIKIEFVKKQKDRRVLHMQLSTFNS